MMKLLFFEPYGINSHHYGTCLELMIEHLKAGDEVHFIGCNAELTSCDVNLKHTTNFCTNCFKRTTLGLNHISKYGTINRYTINDFLTNAEIESLRHEYTFKDVEELKKFPYKDCQDLGYAVASSLISSIREPYPDMAEHHALINALMFSSKKVYHCIEHALEKIKPAKVYAYNGRFSIFRPVLRLSQKNNIEIDLHESGSDLTKYELYKNSLLHDIASSQKKIMDFWTNSSEDEATKKKKAEEFFTLNRKGVSKNWVAFAEGHVWDLPQGWNNEVTNIVVFASSEDEFAAIGDEWKGPIYKSQDIGLKQILESIKPEDNIKVWLRLHPNLKRAPKKLIEPFLAIQSPYLEIILPESTQSSYMLMDNAAKVITFGSLTGLETAYWGKVSILLGMSWYRGLNCVYEPKTHEEAMKFILDKTLKPIISDSPIKYGYYMGNFGIPYKHFKKTSIFTGSIDGWDFSIEEKPTFLARVKRKIKHLLSK